MRVKGKEWAFSIVLIVYGGLMLRSGDFYFIDHPIYPWTYYLMIGIGITIPILAWFLRSPTRVQRKDK